MYLPAWETGKLSVLEWKVQVDQMGIDSNWSPWARQLPWPQGQWKLEQTKTKVHVFHDFGNLPLAEQKSLTGLIREELLAAGYEPVDGKLRIALEDQLHLDWSLRCQPAVYNMVPCYISLRSQGKKKESLLGSSQLEFKNLGPDSASAVARTAALWNKKRPEVQKLLQDSFVSP